MGRPDLQAIKSWLDGARPTTGVRTLGRIHAALQRLESFPLSGQVATEVDSGGRHRHVVVDDCRIFYRVDDDARERFVARVRHGRRRLRSLVLEPDAG